MAYCIVQRPGYFGGNKARVFSSHATLVAARKEKGKEKSICIVQADKRKGDIIWGDMFPHIEES